MKQFIKLSLVCPLLFSSVALAVNPTQGFYLGLLGDISIAPAGYNVIFGRDLTAFGYDVSRLAPGERIMGRVNNNRIGGGGGISLGYRYYQMRAEGQFLYNWNGSNSISIGGCNFLSPVVVTPTPTATCNDINTFLVDNQVGFNGSVASVYGMGNVFYDFISYENDSYVFPYIGLGLGYTQITNRGNFIENYYYVDRTRSAGIKSSFSSFAGQIILGAGMFLDDLTWASMDYRYLTSGTIRNLGGNQSLTVDEVNTYGLWNVDSTRRYIVQSLNFSINMSFDKMSA